MVVAVAAWLAVVVVASALAWFAIGRAGSEVLDPSAQQVPTPAASDPATTPGTVTTSPPPTTQTTTAAPPTSAPGTSAPPSSAPETSAQEKLVTVTGGQAQFRCTGDVLTVPFAQPATGWSVRKDTSDGGAQVRVEFESDEDRFRIEAVCVSGVPSTTVEQD